MQVNTLEAKNQLSKLIKAVEAGQEVIIASRGRPVARLVAVDDKPQGSAVTILDCLDKHHLPKHVRRSEAEIEAAIQQERNAWD